MGPGTNTNTSNMSRIIITSLLLSISLPCLLATFGYGGGKGHGGGYGGGHGSGTACIVKGSYCQCHYCKCEKGHVSCKGYGHEKGYGKSYCYGGTEGEYCHCDYCKCKHGFGQKGGYKGGCGDHKK